MAATQKDINMDQGTTYVLQLYVDVLTNPALPFDAGTNPYIPFNFSGWTAEAKFKDAPQAGSAGTRITATSADRIALDTPGTGYITITLAPSDTDSWNFLSTSPILYNGYWDIVCSYGSEAIKPFWGNFNVTRTGSL